MKITATNHGVTNRDLSGAPTNTKW